MIHGQCVYYRYMDLVQLDCRAIRQFRTRQAFARDLRCCAEESGVYSIRDILQNIQISIKPQACTCVSEHEIAEMELREYC